MIGRLAVVVLAFSLGACTFTGGEGVGGDRDAQASGDGAIDAPTGQLDATPSDPDAATPTVVARVNVGGPAFTGTDYVGDWAADDRGQFCRGGAIDIIDDVDVQNTVDDTLFHYMRFGGNVQGNDVNIVCDIDLAPGDYTVKLHLAEIFRGPGCTASGTTQRDFTVTIEGQDVDRFDLLVENGGCVADPASPDAAPVTKTYDVTTADGVLRVIAGMPADRGLLQAIEVLTRP